MVRPRLGAIVAGSLLVVACGATDSDSNADSAPGSQLAELLGFDVERSPAQARADQLAVEAAVAQCMKAEGFEYIPVDPAQESVVDDIEDFDDAESYGLKYGYGVVHSYERFDEPTILGDGEPESGPQDPNQGYVDSLSDSERNAYYAILHGEQTFAEPEYDDEGNEVYLEPTIEDQGCFGEAQVEVFGAQRFQIDPEITQRLSDFYDDLGTDPDLRAAEEEWLACMNEQRPDVLVSDVPGFTVTDPESMFQLFEFKKSAAMGTTILDYQSDPSGGSSYSSEGNPRAIPDAQLEALRELEISTWAIDNECQNDADIPGIQRRIEQRLVDELRANFPALGEPSS